MCCDHLVLLTKRLNFPKLFPSVFFAEKEKHWDKRERKRRKEKWSQFLSFYSWPWTQISDSEQLLVTLSLFKSFYDRLPEINVRRRIFDRSPKLCLLCYFAWTTKENVGIVIWCSDSHLCSLAWVELSFYYSGHFQTPFTSDRRWTTSNIRISIFCSIKTALDCVNMCVPW